LVMSKVALSVSFTLPSDRDHETVSPTHRSTEALQ
jgi:hypothetical protein